MYSFLTAASFMSTNLVEHHRRLLDGLARRTGVDIRWVEAGSLDDVDVAFSCGLPLSLRDDWTILAAPVGRAAVYENRPVYFTYFVVAADHPAGAFSDLQGVPLVMNQAVSHSGYAAVMAELSSRRLDLDFFSSHRFSGGHLLSLEAVASGSREVAALYSSMFDALLEERPELARSVRVAVAGRAWPAPPLAIRSTLASRLGDLLVADLEMNGTGVPGVHRFTRVAGEAYAVLAANWRQLVPRGGIDH